MVQTANTHCDGVWKLLKERIAHTLFTLGNCYQLPSLSGSFRRLMRDTGLEKDAEGQTRTLYSLRHTYGNLGLLKIMQIYILFLNRWIIVLECLSGTIASYQQRWRKKDWYKNE